VTRWSQGETARIAGGICAGVGGRRESGTRCLPLEVGPRESVNARIGPVGAGRQKICCLGRA